MSSVLETFFILFESDASDARSDVDQLNKSLDASERSADAATSAAANFSEGVQQLSNASKNAAASLVQLSSEEAVKVSQIDNLRSLSNEIASLSEADAINLGKKIGLDEKTIQTLRKGEAGVRELSSSLQKVESPADKASKKFVEMGKSAAGAVGGIFALGAIVAGTLSKATELDELGKFSRVIGENVGEVNAWEQAVIRAGGSADSFRTSVESLNEKVVDASVKGTNEIVPFFNQLGISIVDANGKARSTLELLPELADAFEGLNSQESAGLGKKLGLDQGTILLLQSGRREVEAMVKRQKELGVASAESVAVSEKFNDQLSDLKQVMGFASQEMLVGVLPAVTAVLEVFTDLGMWMNDNQVLVEGFFIGIGLATLKFAIPPMISLATAVWAAIAPFLAIGLAIAAVSTAFALLYEDIVAFENGQDSLIGKIAEKWPIVGDIIKGLIATIKFAFTALTELASFLVDIFTDPMRALEKLKSLASGVADFFGFGDDQDIEVAATKKTINEDITKSSSDGSQRPSDEIDIPDQASPIVNIPASDIPSPDILTEPYISLSQPSDESAMAARESATAIVGAIDRLIERQSAKQDQAEIVVAAQESISVAASSPLASQTSNSIQNNRTSNSRSTSVQTGDIVIQTQATDAEGIASEASGSLERQLRSTVDNFDDGILA